MKIKYFLAFIILTFISCSDSEPPIDGPAGGAYYYINNTSDIDLDIIFIKSVELGLETDDTKTVTSNSSTKIFEDGIIGSNPTPIDSFSEINFYASPRTTETALLTISNIVNDDWIIIEQDLGDSGYGLTKYELTITNNDLN